MLKRYRKALLFLALAVVGALAFFAPEPEEPPAREKGKGGPASSAKRTDANSPARGAASDNAGRTSLNEIPERNILGNARADLFGSRSWQPPPPKVVAPPVSVQAPPPPPPPPPQAYRFAGRLVQDGSVQFYVSKGDTPIPVKPGANLDGYVVESVATDRIALVYPPLGHKESIIVPPGLPGDAPAVPVGMGLGAGAAPAPSLAPPFPPMPPKPAGPAARVQWQGPAQVKMGANFTLALRVVTDQTISGSPMQVRFDPAILESVAVRPGKRYAAEAGRGFNYRLGPEGTIVIGASAKSSAGNDPELLLLTFKPKKAAVQAEVSLASLNLQGPEGRPLAHDVLARYRATVTP